jgi:N-ethylmaleimide reductase
MATYYRQRSQAGLIVTEATVVSKQGIGWQNTPGIFSDKQQESWQNITNAIHEENGCIFLQLWHCGRASHSSFHDGALPVSASSNAIKGDGIYTSQGKLPYETPRELTSSEVSQVVTDFKNAALRAKEAGFDGVEIHSANGYLLDQFLQSKTNQRSDRYGGSIENRCRILCEITEALIEIWEPSRIGVRLSPNGVFNDMGSSDFRETFFYIAQKLSEYKIGYLHVLDGLAFGFHQLGEPITLNDARSVFPKPGLIIGNCGYTLQSAEEAVSKGEADLIAFGRAFISNPDLVERYKFNYPVAKEADMSVWYSFDETGYADFPKYSNS